jgi:putative flavoprotein involved in K+ transport
VPSPEQETLDVIVIGAGQAGLAIGYHLKRRGARLLIVDAGSEVGQVWRSRWDSLRLFTAAAYDGLPGLTFPAPAGTYPTKDEVADYLRAYSRLHELPVQLNTRVVRLHRAAGAFILTTTTGTLKARQVVIATGPFQQPYVPAIASQASADVAQLHSAHYRNPAQFPPGARVLVVGAANSGMQIAGELAGGCSTVLSVGSKPPRLPQRFLGRDLFYWLTRSGLMTMSAERRLAQRFRQRGDLVIGSSMRDLRRREVDIRPRLIGFDGRSARFSDGTSTAVDAVVWATGYRRDDSWIDVPGVVVDGAPCHTGGVASMPGLYFLGLPWQRSRGSSLLGFVKHDAEHVARLVAAYECSELPPQAPARTPAPLVTA